MTTENKPAKVAKGSCASGYLSISDFPNPSSASGEEYSRKFGEMVQFALGVCDEQIRDSVKDYTNQQTSFFYTIPKNAKVTIKPARMDMLTKEVFPVQHDDIVFVYDNNQNGRISAQQLRTLKASGVNAVNVEIEVLYNQFERKTRANSDTPRTVIAGADASIALDSMDSGKKSAISSQTFAR